MKTKTISKAAIAGLFGVAAILGAMPGCSKKGVSGTFTGTAKGIGGDVTVTLTLENNRSFLAKCWRCTLERTALL